MASMAVKVSPMGVLGGTELHPLVSVKASAHRPYNGQIRQQSLSISGHYLAQEAPVSRTLVVSNPSQKRGKVVGSNRPDRRLRACKSSSVSCRCLGSGEFGKGDGDNEVRKNHDKTGENAGTSGGEGQPRQKKKQATAVKMGVPFREMMLTAGRRLQDYLESYKRSKMEARVEDNAESGKTNEQESAWEQLQKVFAEVDERQNLVRQLKFQMDEAIGIEDFKEAGRLKKALTVAMAEDLVANVMIELKKALEEERYDTAAQIRDKAAAGLVGWWAGVSESGSDPYGRIINISPVEGRFIAKGYSARQLALAAAGVPLFEVFLTKDGDLQYQQHAVYLQRDGNGTADSIVGFSKDVLDFENMLGAASKDMKLELDILEENSDEGDEKQMDLEAMEEGMNKILNFLKDRMPDVKMKVFQVIANGKMEADLPKIVEQLMEDAEDELLRQEELADVGSSGSSFEIIKSIDEIPPSGNSTFDNSSENDVGMSMGDIFSNSVYDLPSRVPNRVPARIEHIDRDTFLFEIQDLPGGASSAPPEEVRSVKVVSIATKPAADAISSDVEEVLRSVGQLLVEEGDAVELENSSKDITGILQSAVTRAQQRRGLLKKTLFHRIDLSGTGNDPFSGLYIGSLGPHTAEVVQLQRKYGDWQTDGVNPNGQELQFFEYVEAVKLTGDVNVPAGQVTFRAKVGKDNRLPHRGVYPEELGVVARYKGQARMAEPGFKDPRWVDGELVLLNGKGGPTNGAELGFVYLGPGSHFLVLFGKLRLKN